MERGVLSETHRYSALRFEGWIKLIVALWVSVSPHTETFNMCELDLDI